MQQDKHNITIVVGIIIGLAAATLFLISKYQMQIISDITGALNPKSQDLSFETLPQDSSQNKTTEQDEIAKLQQQIDELKKQQKLAMTPAAPPLIDLKTQEELNKAKQQINSLSQQLSQLQKQNTQIPSPTPITTYPAVVNDADLIKNWQATEKVTQVACLDKFLNSWQLGSGVLISGDGKVLTNQHVVQSSMSATTPDYCLILFNNDYNSQTQTYTKQYRATVIGFFSDRDAAELKINDVLAPNQSGTIVSTPAPGPFPYFQITSAKPQIGDPVYVIGFPESAKFNFSVTKGIISNITSDNLYFGTDAQIDRGNSGGAAINSAGQLIGLPTYKFVSAGDYRGYILNIKMINL